MVSIPSRLPPMPEKGAIASGRPVVGRTFGVLADGANVLNGYRFLRDVHFDAMARQDTLVDTFPGGAVASPMRMIWRTSSAAQRVWIGIWHAGQEASKAGTTAVDAKLYTYPGGVQIGTTYSWTVRTLNQVEQRLPILANRLEGYVSTGWGDDQLMTLAANQGVDVELRLSLTNARVYHVDIVEVYEGDL